MDSHDLMHKTVESMLMKYGFVEKQIDGQTLVGIVNEYVDAGKDDSLMACSQKEERQDVIENFIKKRLNITHLTEDEYEEALDIACRRMGGGDNRHKEMTVFLYILTEYFGRHHHY